LQNTTNKLEAPIVNHAQQPTSRDAVFPIRIARDLQPKLRMCFFGPFQGWDYYDNDTCPIVMSRRSKWKVVLEWLELEDLNFDCGWNALFGYQNLE